MVHLPAFRRQLVYTDVDETAGCGSDLLWTCTGGIPLGNKTRLDNAESVRWQGKNNTLVRRSILLLAATSRRKTNR